MLLDHGGLDGIGQEESHWIKSDIRKDVAAARARGRNSHFTSDIDYSSLGRAFRSNDNSVHADQVQHAWLKDALCKHYISQADAGQTQWLRTAAQIRTAESQASDGTEFNG